jgi:hypothetical protein
MTTDLKSATVGDRPSLDRSALRKLCEEAFKAPHSVCGEKMCELTNAARTALPQLLDEVERLKAERIALLWLKKHKAAVFVKGSELASARSEGLIEGLRRAAEVFRNYAGGAYEMADEKYMRAAAGAVLALAAAEELKMRE